MRSVSFFSLFCKKYINFVGTKCWKFINDTEVALAPQPQTCSFISNYVVTVGITKYSCTRLTLVIWKLLYKNYSYLSTNPSKDSCRSLQSTAGYTAGDASNVMNQLFLFWQLFVNKIPTYTDSNPCYHGDWIDVWTSRVICWHAHYDPN